MPFELNMLREKDKNTYLHSFRVAKMAKKMGIQLCLNEVERDRLVKGCLFHDIGKLFIPEEIIAKPDILTLLEWEIMKKHPSIGAEWIRSHRSMDTSIIDIIEFHHERWDGQGYPCGLKGTEIPAYARICAIIDAFDSMISERPYHRGLSVEEAKEQLLLHSDTQFDRYYVMEFLDLLHQEAERNSIVSYNDNEVLL
ncbi:HD domain-containing protein [Paenibacillus sp. N3.4]|nr:HD domain-containing protein [Paenibacillus sp. N3.4]